MINKLRLIQLFLLTIFIFFISSCEKSFVPVVVNDSTDSLHVKSASFTTDSDTIYLLGTVNFGAQDTLGTLNYEWDFGDGTSEVGGFKTNHQYEKTGIHKVLLKINGLTSSKEIFVFPGMMSYQIKNESKKKIEFKSYVCNPTDFGFVRSNLNSSKISDTIFSNSIGIGVKIDLIAIHIFINNTEYVNTPIIWVKSLQHHIVKIDDSSEFVKMLSTDIGPDKIVLGKL